jgi:hypothetical protein
MVGDGADWWWWVGAGDDGILGILDKRSKVVEDYVMSDHTEHSNILKGNLVPRRRV